MKFICYCMIYFCLISGVSFAQEPLKVASALPAKPYAWIDGNNMVGVGMDILHAFFDELKIELEPILYPWDRSLHHAKTGKIYGIS